MGATKRLEWTEHALAELMQALRIIAERDQRAALLTWERVDRAAKLLAENPLLGRPQPQADVREFPVPRTPLMLIYMPRRDGIVVVSCWHMRRDRLA